jgi:hypothetical protein
MQLIERACLCFYPDKEVRYIQKMAVTTSRCIFKSAVHAAAQPNYSTGHHVRFELSQVRWVSLPHILWTENGWWRKERRVYCDWKGVRGLASKTGWYRKFYPAVQFIILIKKTRQSRAYKPQDSTDENIEGQQAERNNKRLNFQACTDASSATNVFIWEKREVASPTDVHLIDSMIIEFLSSTHARCVGKSRM